MRLGPFHLEEPLGRGGMGEVWRGVHAAQSIPVAVKVIVWEMANNERFRAAFADEVRAVARLHHPSIVSLYDHGVIDDVVAGESDGKLVAGSPYLVMELCTGRSLRGVDTLDNYAELRVVLLQLLDALAHAHARGVVHRDIKPGNVMLTVDDSGVHRLKLTDFGIARAARDGPHYEHGTSSGTGTPGYMAPEQIVGDVLAQGPWTDLYAVGCLAFRLASGNIPYAAAGDDPAVLAAHLRDPVPTLHTTFPVPQGFQAWVERLLQKVAYRRFVRAADAIWALLQLGEAPTVSDMPEDELTISGDDNTQLVSSAPPFSPLDRTLTTMALLDVDEPIDDEATLTDPATSPLPGLGDAPPIPSTFQRIDRVERMPHLVGAGLGLFGLRPIPFVGRQSERSAVWKRLRDVAAGSGPQVVLLHGPSGNGKSRLAEWITQRAHELGSASVLRASHGPVPGPSHGLGAMLARYFDCFGMKRDSVLLQLRAMLGDRAPMSQLAIALTELISPPTAEARPEARVRFASMEERYAAMAQLLAHLSLSRPVVLWIDDVQWGADALGFVEHVLEKKRELRALFVLTLRDEAREERPLESARLMRLMAHHHAHAVEVGPLSPQDHSDLVHKLLGLEGELARQVEARTAGNPLYAVQLVGDWVRRGVLMAGESGFVLRPGERADLPDDLFALWNSRIEQLVSALDETNGRYALEIAAALGDDVHQEEWRAVCALCSVTIPAQLTDRMLESGLGRRLDLGWSFCHGMLREALMRAAEQRASRYHHACVAMLKHRYADSHDLPERVGHHLLAAGAHFEAVAPLLDAARKRLERGDFDRVRGLLAERDAALRTLELPEGDVRYIDGWLMGARASMAQHDFDSVEGLLDKCDRHGVDELQVAQTCQLHAELHYQRGQMNEALELARATGQLFAALDAWLDAADCRVIVAKCLLEGSGDTQTALVEAAAARAHYQEANDRDRLAECDYLTANIHLALGDYDAAQHMTLSAQKHHESEGHRYGLARCANQLGEIERMRGQLVDAERHYLRSAELLEAMSTESNVPRLNLALVQVGRAQYTRAIPALRRLRQEFLEAGHDRAFGHIDYALMACTAAEKDWNGFDEQYQLAAQWVPSRGRVDKDYAALAEKAAGFASMVRDHTRACAALDLAIQHWAALGKTAKADELRRRADALRAI